MTDHPEDKRESVTAAQIVEQRAKGWPDFHPEDYCHKCGRRNIHAWTSPEWPVLVGSHAGILCPVCFADLDPKAIWILTRHRAWSTEREAELAEFLRLVSDIADDADRVASCVLDFLGYATPGGKAPGAET